MKFVSKNAEQRTICFQIKKNSNFELSNRDTELLKKRKKDIDTSMDLLVFPSGGDKGLIPGSGRSPGVQMATHFSILKNPMDRGVW